MPKVKFVNTDDEVEADKGASLMDVTQDAGWPIAYGCEDGLCGTCIVKIVEGKDNVNPPDEKEKQTLDVMGLGDGNFRLACQCKVNGDIAIEQ